VRLTKQFTVESISNLCIIRLTTQKRTEQIYVNSELDVDIKRLWRPGLWILIFSIL